MCALHRTSRQWGWLFSKWLADQQILLAIWSCIWSGLALAGWVCGLARAHLISSHLHRSSQSSGRTTNQLQQDLDLVLTTCLDRVDSHARFARYVGTARTSTNWIIMGGKRLHRTHRRLIDLSCGLAPSLITRDLARNYILRIRRPVIFNPSNGKLVRLDPVRCDIPRAACPTRSFSIQVSRTE